MSLLFFVYDSDVGTVHRNYLFVIRLFPLSFLYYLVACLFHCENKLHGPARDTTYCTNRTPFKKKVVGPAGGRTILGQ